MELIYPKYFEQFSCLAGKCPDSCCKEWDVLVDTQSAAFYRSLPGTLGDRLRQVLTDEDGETYMTIENGRCPMWRQDGLWRIQAELGERALCKTCSDFPRSTHDYGNFMEKGLELSCPEAARLILFTKIEPPIMQSVEGGDMPDYDTEAMDILLQTRETARAILLDDAYSISEALTLLYFHAHHAQTLLDGGEPPLFQPEEILALAQKHSVSGSLQPIRDFFLTLEILTPEWSHLLAHPFACAPWSPEFRNLAVYFVDRYWLQAVSDYDLLCRVKFILISCVLIRALGGNLLRTAQLYSKEIENSTENIQSLLDAAYSHHAFADNLLLGHLLKGDRSQ